MQHRRLRHCEHPRGARQSEKLRSISGRRFGAVLISEFNSVDEFDNTARNFSNLGGGDRYFIQRATPTVHSGLHFLGRWLPSQECQSDVWLPERRDRAVCSASYVLPKREPPAPRGRRRTQSTVYQLETSVYCRDRCRRSLFRRHEYIPLGCHNHSGRLLDRRYLLSDFRDRLA